jgi:hypothetical protein
MQDLRDVNFAALRQVMQDKARVITPKYLVGRHVPLYYVRVRRLIGLVVRGYRN